MFTQPGTGDAPVAGDEILPASEAFRRQMDYYAHAPGTAAALGKMAALEPSTLLCMHGSAFQGNGAALLRALASSVTADG